MDPISEFHDAVRQHALRLSRSANDLDVDAVLRTVDAIPNPPVTLELLEEVCGSEPHEPPGDPLVRLVRALVLHRAIHETEHEPQWRVPLDYEAVLALQQLRSIVSLYPLRLALLDELIALGGPPHLLADWYYARGNTKRGLAGNPSTAEGIEDFERAILCAVEGKNAGALAFSTSAFAKAVVGLPEGLAGEYLDRARAYLDAALASGFEGFRRALLLQAHARLMRKADPQAAAQALAEAVDLVPDGNPFRIELAAEHVSHASLTEPSEVIAELARRYLERAADIPRGIELGLLHAAMGQALCAIGRRSEGRPYLEEALACFRGRDLHNEVETRIQLAIIESEAEQWDALDEQLRLIRAHDSRLSPPQRLDVARIEAASQKARGRLDEHRSSVQGLGDLTYDAEQRLLVRLEQCRLALAEGRPPGSDLDTLIVEAIERHPESSPITVIAVDIVCNSQHPLATPTLDRVAAWAVAHQLFTVIAHVQNRAGDAAGARATLRQALDMELPSHQRLGCLHMLMCLLGDDDFEDRRRIHPEIERMLDHDDAPEMRIDLATSLRRDADHAPDALPRAWYHARRALEGMRHGRGLLPEEHSTLEHTCRTAAQILLDLLRARLPESSPAVADLAAWFEADLPLPPLVRGEARLSAASFLLGPGPFCHTEALQRATQLVMLARQDLGDSEMVQVGNRRIAWVRSRIEGRSSEPAPTHSQWRGGPLDEAPQWLVDLVAGRLESAEPGVLGSNLALLHPVLLARIDVADSLLAHALGRFESMTVEHGARLLDLTLAMVQRVHWTGSGDKPWSKLQAVVNGLIAHSGSSRLQTIAAAIANSHNDAPEPTASTKLDDDEGEHIVTWFERAVALMDYAKRADPPESARPSIDEARGLLTRAVEVARRLERPELRGCLSSLGNAWRIPPGEDLDRALDYYALAGALPAHAPDADGQLCKVKADALLQRGRPEDLREAETLLERAVTLRSDLFKAEALLSLAKALSRHPDLSQEQRAERSAETYLNAARTDVELGARILPAILGALTRWQELQPTSPRPGRLRDELARMYPSAVREAKASRAGFTEAEQDLLARVMKHPAAEALERTGGRLQSAEEAEIGLQLFEGRLPPAVLHRLREELGRNSLVGDLEALETELARLEREEVDAAARPGTLVARALVLGELARAGRRAAADARRATDDAMAALTEVADPTVRAFIITRLTRMWIPHDHAHDPVRDFGFAAKLLQEALSLQGGEEHALLDTIEFLARAYRYSSTGDLAVNLSESRRLYQALLDRARRQGHRDLAANTLHCLAELEDQLAEGDRAERTQRIERLYVDAIEAMHLPGKRAEYTANLALMRTQAAGHLEGQARLAKLLEALETFDRVDADALPSVRRLFVATDRVLCETMIEQHRGNRGASIRRWRKHIDVLGDQVPMLLASSQHNLALALLGSDHVTPDELREALELFARAAQVRTRRTNARHCWETAVEIGRAIAQAMDPMDPLPAEGLPWMPDEAWNQARRWLGEAAAAAEILGPGSELADVGYWMTALTGSAATAEMALDVAAQAWTILDSATPHLVTRAANREREARASYVTAFTLARRLTAASRTKPEPGQPRWVLSDAEAAPVVHWLLRAQQAARRAVRARLARPRGISASTWLEWQQAFQGDDPAHRAKVLRHLRQTAPSFLSDAPDLEQTWRWIEARPGAIAVSVVLEKPVGLVLVAWIVEGRRCVSLLGVEVDASLSVPRRLPEEMRDVILQQHGDVPYAELAACARRTIVEPVTAFLGHAPSTVLWVPDPRLRVVPPTSIWGTNTALATAISLDLLDPYDYPGRHSSTLLGLADPGDLGPEGVNAFLELVSDAARHGSVRVLASSGPKHGVAISTRPGVRDTPASIRDLLAESQEHRTLVLIAHGAVQDPMNAALVCVDAAGRKEYLDVAQLAAHPDAFAGAQVILLSCSSGRVGSLIADPGGLAGTLISAGARWVVAPLWPIYVSTALDVGRRIVRGLAHGEEPWETLARLCAEGSSAHDPTGLVERESFIAWVG